MLRPRSVTLVPFTDGSFALLCPAGLREEHAYKLRVVRRALRKRYGSVFNSTFLPIWASGEGRWEALACGLKVLLSSFLPILSFQPPLSRAFIAQLEKFSLGCDLADRALQLSILLSHFVEQSLLVFCGKKNTANEPR